VPRRYSEIVNWLDEKRFYLLEKDCDTVNRAVEAIEARIVEDKETWVRVERRRWSVDPAMREDWYYE